MKHIFLYIALMALMVAGALYTLNRERIQEEPAEGVQNDVLQVADYKRIPYMVDGVSTTLLDSGAEQDGDTSGSYIVTRYFGNELYKDLNNDNREDVVFLLTQETGGSGTFFYVAAALNTEKGYVGSEALFLGDRIAPQTTESGPGNQVVVNYADRRSDEPMSAQPSMGKSLRLILDPQTMQFGEVVADFEGEADPDRMTLGMKTWIWQSASYNDGRTVVPNTPGVFTLTFSSDGSFSAGTDCNSVGGGYTTEGDQISFTNMRSTLMYCEGSQEGEFLQMLEHTAQYHFTSRGELILGLQYDSGTLTFR